MSKDTAEVIFFEALRSGNEDAIKELYEAKRKWLMVLARAILGPDETEQAQDIVHDFFLHFIERRYFERIESADTLEGFMASTVKNRCLDELRHRD
jgi:DNA-directed RNA polymerase specialized sigma24 family protein